MIHRQAVAIRSELIWFIAAPLVQFAVCHPGSISRGHWSLGALYAPPMCLGLTAAGLESEA